jgi:1,4-dihydroxy-6-naphthoate synthase
MGDRRLLLGHSPDPDDAFMFYALAKDCIPTDGWEFEHILQDIQTLNERALRGELHITAISIHAYPYLMDRYALMNCGSSMGDGYGPMVVAPQPMDVADLEGKTILIPGEMTTAFLALNLLLGKDRFQHRCCMFDEILPRVAAGEADAGLIIHEGQLTYQNNALHCIVDLGAWWQSETQLPLPLGGNAIRRDIGAEHLSKIAAILHHSIEYGLSHREEAVSYALSYARDMGQDLADQFVGMYVNKWTLDYGDKGREAVRLLLRKGRDAGLVPDAGEIDFVR